MGEEGRARGKRAGDWNEMSWSSSGVGSSRSGLDFPGARRDSRPRIHRRSAEGGSPTEAPAVDGYGRCSTDSMADLQHDGSRDAVDVGR